MAADDQSRMEDMKTESKDRDDETSVEMDDVDINQGDTEEPMQEADSQDKSDLTARLSKVEAEREEYLRMVQRIQAEFDNYRKRNKKAVSDTFKAATADTVETFLPVLDNLERALDSTIEAGAQEAVVKGIEMIIRQFRDTLGKLNVEEIEALNQPFDPELHNAVMQVESDNQDTNTVVEVLQKGYRIGERVIRYSMVKVAK